MRTWQLALVAGVFASLSASAAVKVQIVEGRPLVNGVYLNGHGPYRFLIDTGSTLNHFDPRLARSAGLKPTFRTEMVSSTGTTDAPGAEGIEVALDTIRVTGQKFLFAGTEALHRAYPDVQGILGQEFLSHFDYLLDLAGKRIEFGPRETQPSETRQTFESIGGRPVITTSLGALVLDSGANHLTLFRAQALEITHQVITMTGLLRVGLISSNLVIGGQTFWRGDAVAIPRSIEPGVKGLLPASLFKAVYVSNSEGYVVLHH